MALPNPDGVAAVLAWPGTRHLASADQDEAAVKRPRCRNCGLLERQHDADGIFYGPACDDYEEGDEVEDEYNAEDDGPTLV